MKFIQPTVEWWPQETIAQQIAKVGRICYKSKQKEPPADLTEDERKEFIEDNANKLCRRFWKSGHCSMYRHGSAYFFIKHENKLPRWIWEYFKASPFIDCVVQNNKVWISTNMQFLCEHDNILKFLDDYGIDEQEFIDKAMQYKCPEALMLLRMTMAVTTQISTTRELNRTSPNNIAEQSTRYVNMKKKGGVQIATPHWFQGGVPTLTPLKHRLARLVFRTACKFSEWMYLLLLKLGLQPQDARGVLPLDAYSVVAYTYNLYEWKHIIDLRYHGTTGTPHPNAQIAAEQISEIINSRLQEYVPEFEI